MGKKSTPAIEILCPCCQARLKVDPQLAVVLSHEAPPRTAPDVDLNDPFTVLQKQAAQREDKFRQSWEAEKNKEDVLARKFEENLKKAKDAPLEKPIRDFDLD